MANVTDEVRVVDADAHMTEPHDLWTKRAPKGYEDRVPRVAEVDGKPMWVIEGRPFAEARGGAVIGVEGNKEPFYKSQAVWTIDQVHRAAYDPAARLEVLDQAGLYAQVLYPNRIGLAGQDLVAHTEDPLLRRMCIEIYNDAMAEMQDWSGNRLIPMPLLPAWSVEESVREAERVAQLGLRGVNLTTDPQDMGAPDLANQAWDPLWEVCANLELPVHFHIGASSTAMNFWGKYFLPSVPDSLKGGIGGAMLFINNARILINTIYAGIFDRFPTLKMVSVESGIGWIPFMMETMDYQLVENDPEIAESMTHTPSEYFKRNWYGTFWFEKGHGDLQGLIDTVGEDNVLFETDFPHPTCLYPSPLETVRERIETLRPETRRKVMGGNALALYKL